MSMLLGSECVAQDPGGLVILDLFSDLTSDLSGYVMFAQKICALSRSGASHRRF